MLSLVGFDLKVLKEISQKSNQFKQKIIEDELQRDHLTSENKLPLKRTAAQSKSLRFPKSQGILKKYLLHACKLSILMLIASLLNSLNYLSIVQSIDDLNRRVSNLYYVGRYSTKVNTAGSTFLDLIAENGTTYMRSQPSLITAGKYLTEINDFKLIIAHLFSSNDNYQIFTVTDILFNDACAYTNGTIATYCNGNARGQNKTGLIQITTDLEYHLRDLKTDFETSDRQRDTLRQLESKVQNQTLPLVLVLQRLGETVYGALKDDIDNKVLEIKTQTRYYYSGLMVLTVLFLILIHKKTLLKLREADNEFKKVLQLFPPSMVLTHYKLKSYLVKNSNGVLDSVRNEIEKKF